MKRLLLVLLPISLFVFSCEDVIDEVEVLEKFNKIFFDSGDYESYDGKCVYETLDLGYVIMGEGPEGIFLLKTNQNGNQTWLKTFSNGYEERGNHLQITNDGGYIISGGTRVSENGNTPEWFVWLIKTDSDGNKEWEKTYEGSFGGYVLQTIDNGYIIGCQINNNGGLIKTDSNGNEEWRVSYDGLYTSSTFIYQFQDESYLTFDSVIRKVDNNGNQQWVKSIDGKGLFGSVTVDGGFIFTGQNQSNDFYTVKTDIEGNVEWSNQSPSFGNSGGHSVLEISDGGFIVCGYEDGISNDQLKIVKYNNQGEVLWGKSYGGEGHEKGYSIDEISNSGFIISGVTNDSFDKDGMWLIKTDSEGNFE